MPSCAINSLRTRKAGGVSPRMRLKDKEWERGCWDGWRGGLV